MQYIRGGALPWGGAQLNRGNTTFGVPLPAAPESFPGALLVGARFELDDGSSYAVTTAPLDSSSSDLHFDIPSSPFIRSPAQNAVGVGTTPSIAFDEVQGASAYAVVVLSGRTAWSIVGAGSPIQIPDLSPFGLGLQPSGTVHVAVIAIFGESFDDLVAGAPLGSSDTPVPGVSARSSTLLVFTP